MALPKNAGDQHRHPHHYINEEKKGVKMKSGSMIRMAALASIAGLGNALGSSIAGYGSIMNGYRAGAIVPTKESTTTSPNVSQWGYANGPGWNAAHVKRMATKRRNRTRHKLAVRGRK